MSKQLFSTLLLFCVITTCSANRINHSAMQAAYLEQDMSKWGVMLTKYKALQNLTLDEQLALSNYLYGYAASVVESGDKKAAKEWITIWEGYLANLEKEGMELSQIHTFRAAIAAYRTKIFPTQMLKYYKECIEQLDSALILDPKNPIAVGLQGNVRYYLPKVLGGGKQAAINSFSTALPLFEKDLKPYQRWSYMGTWLCLAQAYEKIGNKKQAIAECRKILKVEPTHAYVRDTYLPSLLSGKTVTKTALDF